MATTSKENDDARPRVLQTVIVKRVIADFSVSGRTALLWLRSNGPTPCKRISQKAVYYWQDEADAWVKELSS